MHIHIPIPISIPIHNPQVNEAKVNKFENLPNHAHLKEEIELKRIVTYLLQRLQYSDVRRCCV
ncbi:hypothetical protein EON65_44300 [archaeon]|nr:MAG: hypothetical protein EON65_44300 [archaeon]